MRMTKNLFVITISIMFSSFTLEITIGVSVIKIIQGVISMAKIVWWWSILVVVSPKPMRACND